MKSFLLGVFTPSFGKLGPGGNTSPPQRHLDIHRRPRMGRPRLLRKRFHRYAQHRSIGQAEPSPDWKLTEYLDGTDDLELYHIANDLSKSINLAGERKGKVADLKRKLMEWRNEVLARLPIPQSIL